MTVQPTKLVTLTIEYNGSTGYCLSAKHANGSTTWYYDSLGGGIQAKGSTGCLAASGGTPGGTRTG